MSQRLRTGLLAALVLTVAVGLVVWWSARRAAGRTVKLPDGSELSVIAVTFGKEHRYVEGKPLAKIVSPIWPDRFKGFLKLATHQRHTDAPSLMVWCAWRRAPTNGLLPNASVFGEHGVETEPAPPASWTAKFAAWHFANFPRRGPTIGLRFYQRNPAFEPVPVGDVRFRNPAAAEYPRWTPQPFPAKAQEGGTEFTLLNVVSDRFGAERLRPYRGYIPPWTSVVLGVTRNGQPTDEWKVERIEAGDATGNQFVALRSSYDRVGDYQIYGFNHVLWPEEPACKLRVEFSRARDFATNELWTAPSVALPAAGLTTEIYPTVEMQGVTLRTLELQRIGPASMMDRFPRTALASLLVAPPANGVRVRLVAAADERGRPVPFQLEAVTADGSHRFGLATALDAKGVDLTFAIHRSRFVEFLAKPAWIGVNAARNPGQRMPE